MTDNRWADYRRQLLQASQLPASERQTGARMQEYSALVAEEGDMGALDRLQAAIKDMSEDELAELAKFAEQLSKRDAPAAESVRKALAVFARYRGTYAGDFDRESLHDR